MQTAEREEEKEKSNTMNQWSQKFFLNGMENPFFTILTLSGTKTLRFVLLMRRKNDHRSLSIKIFWLRGELSLSHCS